METLIGQLEADYGLRTPNEGINQRNLKFWTDAHCSETRQNVQKEPKIQHHGFDRK